jgi:hypothetical protein
MTEDYIMDWTDGNFNESWKKDGRVDRSVGGKLTRLLRGEWAGEMRTEW